jgi:hypothetical protein
VEPGSPEAERTATALARWPIAAKPRPGGRRGGRGSDGGSGHRRLKESCPLVRLGVRHGSTGMTHCASLRIVASLRSVDEVGGAGERGAERRGFGSGQEGQLVVLAAGNGYGHRAWFGDGAGGRVHAVGALDVDAPWVRVNFGVMTSGRAPSNRPWPLRTTHHPIRGGGHDIPSLAGHCERLRAGGGDRGRGHADQAVRSDPSDGRRGREARGDPGGCDTGATSMTTRWRLGQRPSGPSCSPALSGSTIRPWPLICGFRPRVRSR